MSVIDLPPLVRILAFSLSFLVSFIPGLIILVRTRTTHLALSWLILLLTAWSEIIVISLMVGWTATLSSFWVFILIQIGIALLTAAVCRVNNQELSDYRDQWIIKTKGGWDELRNAFRDRFLFIFIILITAAVFINLYLGIRIPANNNDSLSTHLVRVAYWFQHGSLLPWPTDQVFQIIYPFNAQLIELWILKITGSDVLFASIQWMAVISSGLMIYAISRQLNLTVRTALYIAGIFLCTPILVLQSSTTQTDAVIGFLFLTCIFFIFEFMAKRQPISLVFLFVSIGIGIGVKQIFWFTLPGVGIALLWNLISTKSLKAQIKLLPITVAIILALGGAVYIQNQVVYQNPIGPKQIISEQTSDLNWQDLAPKLAINLTRFFYQSIDTSGLPDPLDGYAQKIKERTIGKLLVAVNPAIEGNQYLYKTHVFSIRSKNRSQEDFAWFGLVGWLIGSAGFILGIRAVFKRISHLTILFGTGLLYTLLLVLLRPGWDAYQGRYFIPAFASFYLCGTGLLSSLPKIWLRILSAFGVLALFVCTLTNPGKPMLGDAAKYINIWQASRAELQTDQNNAFKDVVVLVDQIIPANNTVGLFTNGYAIQYPFFGERFTRRLIPIYPVETMVNAKWLSDHQIDYILANMDNSNTRPPSQYEKIAGVAGWRIYRLIK